MRGDLLRFSSALAAVASFAACSNIIGISSYEVDPSLDQAGSSSSGGKRTHGGESSTNGGTNAVLDGGASPGGDTNTPRGGTATGGTVHAGGETTQTLGGATNTAGAVGEAGSPATTCTTNQDCDDTIDCTNDTCLPSGECSHTAKDNLCDPTRCETCQVGIGCVAGPTAETQVLLDPNFDLATGDWDDSGSDITNIVTNNAAQTPAQIAKFGPKSGSTHEYDDLLQYLTLPPGVVGLTVTGYYKLTPTTAAHTSDPDDYVTLQLYDVASSSDPVVEFHSFHAGTTAQTTWKAFSYAASKSELAMLKAGGDYSFDLVGHVFSAFQFDTMTLTTTTCQ